MNLHLQEQTAAPELGVGELVEIDGEQVFYLGEILGRQGPLLMVAVEHAVNRASLSAIQDVWQSPRSV